jgi:apolipoprotein N-acyltransferase
MAFSPASDSLKTLSSRQRVFCVIATSILWWISLQHIGCFALGWIALAPLLYALSGMSSARSRFWLGWRAGVLCFALINWWILPAIIKGGAVINVSPPAAIFLGVLAVLLIGLIHGVGVALIALLWNPRAKWFKRAPLLLPLGAAASWWIFETVRATGVLAHSWGALGFSQWRDVALLQSANVIGQHGLSALCFWFAANLALWLRSEYSAHTPSLWRAPLAVFLVLHMWGAWRIWSYDQSAPSHGIKVLLVQTNISSLRKNRDGGESHFDQAERLTKEYFERGEITDLIVWPETTAELFKAQSEGTTSSGGFDTAHREQARRAMLLARGARTPLLLGAQVYSHWQGFQWDGATELSNQAVLFSPDGLQQSSSKMRVVPFGERAPYAEYLPFLKHLAPSPAVVPAETVAPLGSNQTSMGTLICFESCFPDPAKSLIARGAKVLFVLTNDEWCAGTTAPWEHAAMSTLRAVENDVPVAQCANGGHSFAVDARGRFLSLAPYGETGVLAARLPIR